MSAARWWVVRIGVAACVFGDQLTVLAYDLMPTLWAPAEAGGIADPLGRDTRPLIYQLLPATTGTTWGLFGVWMAGTVAFGLGLATRLSGAVMLLAYAQTALILPAGDRGIDMMVRNVLLLLLFSSCGKTWSLDARLRTGSWRGDGALVPAWPRHLLILQLGIMYFTAGVQKVGMTWTPMGGWSALYIVLQDPAIARVSVPWLPKVYPLTQVATALTWVWEWSTPLLVASFWYRDTRDRPGRLRAALNRLDFRAIWVAFGVLFHVGIAVTMRIGIFPFAMLALYPCFFHPDEVRRALGWGVRTA